jgi:hypothetical protein
MPGRLTNTRRTNANAGDLHTGELQVLGRVRSMQHGAVGPAHKSHMSCKTWSICLMGDYRSNIEWWAKVTADERKRD